MVYDAANQITWVRVFWLIASGRQLLGHSVGSAMEGERRSLPECSPELRSSTGLSGSLMYCSQEGSSGMNLTFFVCFLQWMECWIGWTDGLVKLSRELSSSKRLAELICLAAEGRVLFLCWGVPPAVSQNPPPSAAAASARAVGSIADYDPLNGQWGAAANSQAAAKIRKYSIYSIF